MSEENKSGMLSKRDLEKINDYLDSLSSNSINEDKNLDKEKFIKAVEHGISKGKEENIEGQEKFIKETKEISDMVNAHSKIVLNDALLKIGSGQATRDDYPNIPELQNIKEGEPSNSEKFISHVITGGNASSYDEVEKFMNTDFDDDEYTIKPKR